MNVVSKINKKYLAVCIGAQLMADRAMAATGGNGAADSAATVQTGLTAVMNMLPVGAQVLGFILAGGGLFQIHKYQKSQGRDGSMGGGIAGIGIGVCLFALGGFMKWMGTSIGVDASDVALPTK